MHPTNESLQLGISTYSFPWAIGLNHFSTHAAAARQLVQVAHSYQIHYVQFGDNLPLHGLSYEELKKLKETATEKNISIETGTRGLKRDNLVQYLSIAQQLQSPFLRVVIDEEGYEPGEAEVTEIIKDVLPQFREAGIRLALENHDRFPVRRLKQIIETTDPEWVTVCLDTANSLGANEGIEEVLQALAPHAVNLHIKDISIQRVRSKMGFKLEGCPAGQGILDIPAIVNRVKEYGRCNTATLEVWSNAAATPEATVQQEQEWVEKSITYLKTIVA
jgi:sugar phosphate isomerase/epimerase